MLKYALQRILYMLVVFCIITFICFVLIRMLPPVVLPPDDPHTQMVLMRREALGYNEPYIVQFGLFVKNVVTKFDWGLSEKLYFGQDVWDVFVRKLPATMIVNLYSILWSIPVGVGLGIFAALKKNTWVDYFLSTATMVVISVPSFVYAFLVQYVFCFKLQWFPFLMAGGSDYFSWEMFRSMIPPVLSLSFGVIAGFTRTTRAELTEVLTSEFMLLARTKGLTRAQAVKTSSFYFQSIGIFCLSLAGMGISNHAISYFTDIGYSPLTASTAMSLVMTIMIGAKILLGAVFDKIGSVRSAILTGLCMIASTLSIRFAGAGAFMPYVFSVCFGFGYSTLTVPYSYLIGQNFGTREFSSIYSLICTLGSLGGGIAATLTGMLYDRLGSYYPVWTIYFVLACLALTFLFLASKTAQDRGYQYR